MPNDHNHHQPIFNQPAPSGLFCFKEIIIKTSQELWSENFRTTKDGRVKPLSYQHQAEWQDAAAAEDAAKNAASEPVPYRRYAPNPERINAALLKMESILCKSH